jgi:hypothetical protein
MPICECHPPAMCDVRCAMWMCIPAPSTLLLWGTPADAGLVAMYEGPRSEFWHMNMHIVHYALCIMHFGFCMCM